MKKTFRNNKPNKQGDLPERIENSKLGAILIIFSDLFFSLVRSFTSKKKTGHLVIIALHRIGDSVFTIPAIKKIFKYYKNYNKVIISYSESKNIYKLVFTEKIITLDRTDFKYGGRIASSLAAKTLKETNPEIIFDLTGAVTSATLIFKSNADRIIGMNDRIFQKVYDRFIRKRTLPHLIDKYLDVAALEIPFNRSYETYSFNNNINKGERILIHPFAGWKAKEWNIRKFVQLGEALKNKFDIVFLSKPGLIPPDIQSELKILNIRIIITQTVEELINELKNSALIISNDSGPLYIANLLGKPTFTIYGPTNPEYSLPFGKNHDYIQKIIECSPEKDRQYCFTDAGRKGCPSFECMNQLTVEEVLQKLNEFFNKIEITSTEKITNAKSK